MIKSWKHKGLIKFYETGIASGINSNHATRIFAILNALDSCDNIEKLNLPGFRLHKLKGQLKDFYSISVSSNWRIIFKFDGQDVTDVDYLDYH
jgi:proteic killer suppression protein